jgi:hypothetical protein
MRDRAHLCDASGAARFVEILEGRLCRADVPPATAIVAAAASGDVCALLDPHGVTESGADELTIPPAYSALLLMFWGEPFSAGTASGPDAGRSAAEQALRWGLHNDAISGVFVTRDERTLFVGIQHPAEPVGELAKSVESIAVGVWPQKDACSDGLRPRSACVVITRKDGGPLDDSDAQA